MPSVILGAAGIVTATIGFLALLGWVVGLPRLTSFGADLIPMAPSTAVLFLLYGVAVCMRARLPLSRRVSWISVAMVGFGTLVALLLFTLSCLNIHWAAEHLGLNITRTVREAPTGHISPVSAACFLVASLSFLASFAHSAARFWRTALAFVSAGVLLGFCFIFLLAYLFGTPLLYGGRFIPPALNTILAFAALGLALLTLAGWPVRLFGESPAGGSRAAVAFVLIFALLAAGIVASSYIYYRRYEQQYRTEIEHQLSAVAELKVNELTRWREERLGDGVLFSKNLSFSALVRRFFAQPADADVQRQLLDWLGKFPMSYGYDQIRLMDAQGVTRLSLPGGLNPATSDTLRVAAEVMRSGQIILQDFYRHERNHRVYLQVMVPILDELDSGRPLGVVELRIDPAFYLYPFLKRWPTPSRTSETLLVRRDGNDALFLSELRFRTNTALNLRTSLENTNMPVAKAVLGQEGIAEGRDYRGVPVIADHRAVPNSPWFLVSRMDTEEVYAPLRERMWLTVLLVGVLLLSAGTSAGLLRRQQRLQFYKERAQAADTLRQSEERYRAVADSANEAIITANGDGNIVGWNRGAERAFGYTEAEILGQPLTRLMPHGYRDPHAEGMKRIVAGGARHVIGKTVELEGLRKDGSAFPVELSLAEWQTDAGHFYTGILRDITKRKAAEAERDRLLADLQMTLAEVKTLQGIIPICAGCKKIRDDQGFWSQVETYVAKHSRAKFSHGLCPDCVKKWYPDMEEP